jgi:putative ABC transport system ATP-binding protein
MADDELAEIRKDKIGFVFQSFNLLPRTTVLRNVVLPLVYAGVPQEEREERAAAALTASGLTKEHFAHLSNQLSGGQIQRVAIARALAARPDLIVADGTSCRHQIADLARRSALHSVRLLDRALA